MHQSVLSDESVDGDIDPHFGGIDPSEYVARGRCRMVILAGIENSIDTVDRGFQSTMIDIRSNMQICMNRKYFQLCRCICITQCWS